MADKGIYTVGGTVQAGAGVYIKRQADDELQDLCRRHQFAYLLAARQVGKSSLMIRTAERLVDANVRPVIIDVTLLGTQATDEEWYLGFLSVINRQLNLKFNVAQFWHQQGALTANQRFAHFIEEILIAQVEQPIVIFVDEIDTTLSLPYRDDFFATIRYLFNARATTPGLGRLSFTLIGVASPSDLINDPKRTPFNVGYRVDLTDFTFAEASVLADGLGLPHRDAEDVLRWVLDWTGGHPYLTQRLCSAIVEKRASPQSRQDIDRIVDSVFLGEMSERDNNLQFVRDMLTERAPDRGAALATYREILVSRHSVPDEQQSLIISHLKLSGIVCGDGAGGLRVRNRIYRKVFDRQWIRSHRPENWWRVIPNIVKLTAAAILLLAVALLISLLFAVGQYRQARELADARAAEVVLRSTAEAVAQENRRLAERRAEESLEAQATAEEALKRLEEQTRLLVARQLADDAVENLDNFDLSLLLSVEASRMAATRETRGSLLTVLERQFASDQVSPRPQCTTYDGRSPSRGENPGFGRPRSANNIVGCRDGPAIG